MILKEDAETAVKSTQLTYLISQHIRGVNVVMEIAALSEMHTKDWASIEYVSAIEKTEAQQAQFGSKRRIEGTKVKGGILLHNASDSAIKTDLFGEIVRDEEVEIFRTGIAPVEVGVVKKKLVADVGVDVEAA